MSQKTVNGITTTYCDEENCNNSFSMIKKNQNYAEFNALQRAAGWFAKRTNHKNKKVFNSWEHYCSECKSGRLSS